MALEDFFRVADGVEGARAGADGADAHAPDAADDAAHGDEFGEVGAEGRVERVDDVFGGERVGDAGLAEIIADGNFAAEGVSAADDVEFVELVRIALDEDGDVEAGDLEGVGHAFLVAEVWQANEHARNLVAIAAE